MAIFYHPSLAFLVLIFLGFSSAQGEYLYLGCYWDNTVRALPDLVSCDLHCICSNSMPYCETTSMTVDFCVDLCKSKNFTYAGLQSATQCFCGNEDAMYSQHGEAMSCTANCSGNSSQVCGDVYRNSVYDTLYRSTGCPQPNSVLKGRIDKGEKVEYFAGDSITYICEGTAFMLGEPTRTCLASGMWDNPSPECRTVCNEQVSSLGSNRGTPIPVEEFISSINVEGEQYVLPCLTGYTGTSEFILATCQSDGTWNFNSTDFACEAVVCSINGLGEGVIVIGSDFTYLSIATFRCDVGYTPSSDTTRQCQADGTWSGVDIYCILVFCSPPLAPEGTSVLPGPYKYGEYVTYFCVNPDATLIGDPMRMCTADGSWSGQEPICLTDTTTITTNVNTQRPTTTRVRTTGRPVTTMQPPTTQSATTKSATSRKVATTTNSATTTQSATTMQLMTTVHRTTSASKTLLIPSTTNKQDNLQTTIVDDNMSSANEMSTLDASMTSLNVPSSSQSLSPSTTSDGFNEKAKGEKSPADFMVLIVIIAGVFSVLFLAIIFTVACLKSPRRRKVQVTKQINFISSKETGSMNDMLWSDGLSPDSPRSRADSGLPPSDRNSPSSNDSADGSGAGGVVNLAFENDDVFKTHEDDPYHRIDFGAVNESNNVSSVLMNSGIMSPAPQTQDDRKPISHSRVNSFQQPDDVESLYARVDLSKKTNRSPQNGVDRTLSTSSDYKSEENPLYQTTQRTSPKSLLEPAVDNGQLKSNGDVRKTSRRTPSDVSVSSRSYWAQYEEQVTRL
ncbi:uncharacterized protein LOC117123028 isoform X2 [Anneissia japonica]|uniref:uncharacterized protein LOC117123028 isoform X2 n=1 Tax=Anneissia japonica TaxID=1529436 RepID=UPI001425A9F6|nr:uncharacterized protein LOC117123028 isoform X2 [Anneissia japonica]